MAAYRECLKDKVRNICEFWFEYIITDCKEEEITFQKAM